MTMPPTVRPISRRGFLGVGIAAAAGLAASAARAAQERREPERFFRWEEAAPGVWVAMAPDGAPSLGGNSTVLLGDDGAVLIDTKYAAVATGLRREAASRGKPLAAVINTHHHADHTGGNHAFGDLPILAHPGARARVLAQHRRYLDAIPGIAASLAKMEGEPARVMAAEAHDLIDRAPELPPERFAPTRDLLAGAENEVGGLSIRVLQPGSAHTDNDTALYFRGSNVLVAGDLLFHAMHPFLDRAGGGTCAGWIEALAALEAVCDANTVVVPGHGAVAGREALRRQADYLGEMRALMEGKFAEGAPREQAVRAPLPESYAEYGLARFFPVTLGAIYDEVAAAGSGGGSDGAPR